MTLLDHDYIIATYGRTELVHYVAQQIALSLSGKPGTKWAITSDGDFVILSFASQQEMWAVGKRWRALAGGADLEEAA
jgi:hypothetical protein